MKISIIVPIYNVEKELERCVESLIHQSYNNIEIILVDDGSTDRSSLICDEYRKKDNRIKVIHKKNGGLSDARNVGIENSTGEYLMFVDSDDYILYDACEKFINQLEDSVDIIVGECKMIYECGKNKYQKHTSLNEKKIYSSKEYIIKSINNNEFYAPVCFNMYRRKFVVDNSLYFHKGIYHEDMEYLLKTSLCAKKIKCLKYEFYQYVVRNNSINGLKENFFKNIKDSFFVYSKWKERIDCIEDLELKNKLYSVLCKYIITTCRRFKVCKDLPTGINNLFLIKHALNFKEFLKTICFVSFRKIYINL